MIGNAVSGNAAAVLQAKVRQWLTGHDEVTDNYNTEIRITVNKMVHTGLYMRTLCELTLIAAMVLFDKDCRK